MKEQIEEEMGYISSIDPYEMERALVMKVMAAVVVVAAVVVMAVLVVVVVIMVVVVVVVAVAEDEEENCASNVCPQMIIFAPKTSSCLASHLKNEWGTEGRDPHAI
jgi:hypothetical protein